MGKVVLALNALEDIYSRQLSHSMGKRSLDLKHVRYSDPSDGKFTAHDLPGKSTPSLYRDAEKRVLELKSTDGTSRHFVRLQSLFPMSIFISFLFSKSEIVSVVGSSEQFSRD